jgi:hypothetical protein
MTLNQSRLDAASDFDINSKNENASQIEEIHFSLPQEDPQFNEENNLDRCMIMDKEEYKNQVLQEESIKDEHSF